MPMVVHQAYLIAGWPFSNYHAFITTGGRLTRALLYYGLGGARSFNLQ